MINLIKAIFSTLKEASEPYCNIEANSHKCGQGRPCRPKPFKKDGVEIERSEK